MLLVYGECVWERDRDRDDQHPQENQIIQHCSLDI